VISFCVWASDLIAFQLPLTCAWQQYVSSSSNSSGTCCCRTALMLLLLPLLLLLPPWLIVPQITANCAAATVLFVPAYLWPKTKQQQRQWPVNQWSNSNSNSNCNGKRQLATNCQATRMRRQKSCSCHKGDT